MEYLIGLKFNEADLPYKKIDRFRETYDEKYKKNLGVYMPILAPFQLTHPMRPEDLFELIDLIGNYFYQMPEHLQMEMNGLGFMASPAAVVLNPMIHPDIYHLQESLLYHLEEDLEVTFRHKKPGMNPYVVLARVSDKQRIPLVLDVARVEFEGPFILNVSEIALYEKNPIYSWQYKKSLKTFKIIGDLW